MAKKNPQKTPETSIIQLDATKTTKVLQNKWIFK